MGMFDDIQYEGRWFQTKDFECQMHKYYIENGRLLTSVGHTEDRSDATAWQKEHPGEELPKELQGFMGMCGCATWVEDGRQDTNHHGWLNFYTRHDKTGEWEEYNAKFTDGQMVEITRVPDEDNGAG